MILDAVVALSASVLGIVAVARGIDAFSSYVSRD